MSIKWFGLSCFEIEDSTTIVTDPYDGNLFGLDQLDVKGDIVSISHSHLDHNSGKYLARKKETEIIDKPGERVAKGIKVEGIPNETNYKRGNNIYYIFELDRIRICHLGDLGYRLSERKIDEIKPVDVLLIPVGGTEGHEGREAIDLLDKIDASIIIPMHYGVEGMDIGLSDIGRFLESAKEKDLEIIEKDEIEIETLPKNKKIIKLACQTV
ncbi:hypothetical protein AKJ52_02415 [candidate division MSBL1 archaeon SCGC-AAA382C18]|uniref:Zn-dependent hydrolase n=1 Tax=candidate division MSBL1 archaeon SCGC-AAA382C18 TaxID=1698281 RepID=A0A133VIH3_9EURY|nr:hypothetical protein AKJ52_02415 [candidate division MSBL1 archaeon SCGC-AAA382C18]